MALAPRVVETGEWVQTLLNIASRGDADPALLYGVADRRQRETDVLNSRTLNALGALPTLDALYLGARAATREERVNEALGTVVDWAERFDNALWQNSDDCAAYMFALSDLNTQAAPSARASGVVSIERTSFFTNDDSALINDEHIRISVHHFQLLDVPPPPAFGGASDTALRHTTVWAEYDKYTREQLVFELRNSPHMYADGQFAGATAGDAQYALVAQMYARVVRGPTRPLEADDLIGTDNSLDWEAADKIVIRARRGRFFADVLKPPPPNYDVFIGRRRLFLDQLARDRIRALAEADPRSVYIDLNDPALEDDDRLVRGAENELLQLFRYEFVRQPVATYELYHLGWPQTIDIMILRRELRAWLKAFFDEFYAPCALPYLANGRQEWYASLAQAREQNDESSRMNNQLFFDDDSIEELF